MPGPGRPPRAWRSGCGVALSHMISSATPANTAAVISQGRSARSFEGVPLLGIMMVIGKGGRMAIGKDER
ncbi:hypothetical protein D3C76_1115180 [compost metagenome]